MKHSIFIDAGHGGVIFGTPQTPGKRSPDGCYLEGVHNRYFAGILKREIQTYCISAPVVELMDGCPIDVPMSARVNAINKCCTPDDIYIGIHTNAASNSGWQDRANGARFIYQKNITESKSGKELANELFAEFPHRSGAMVVKPFGKNLYMLRKTKCRSVIVELDFHDNRESVSHLESYAAVAQVKWLAQKLYSLAL